MNCVPTSVQIVTSMRSIEAAIEADQIIGDLVERARLAGIETPLLAAIYTHLGVYQRRVLA